jgi:hypothetical protein
LINKDDVEHYTESLDTPAMKIGAGMVGAATVGCICLGPVGLLVGAAAVGIGVGMNSLAAKVLSGPFKNHSMKLSILVSTSGPKML